MKLWMALALFLGLGLAIFLLLGVMGEERKLNKTTAVRPPASLSKDNRLLGIALTMAEDNNFDNAFAAAQTAGMQVKSFTINWSDYEIAPAQYQPAADYLAIANDYYPQRNIPLILVITPVDNVVPVVPGDLRNRTFNDPVLIERFKKFLDYIFAKIPNVELHSIFIGSEYDAFLGKDEQKWQQYQVFFKSAKEYIKSKRPGVPIGVETTISGFTDPLQKVFVKRLNAAADVIGVSYYAVNNDMTARDPKVVHDDFAKLAAEYPDALFIFHQYGYPSSKFLGSSEQKQAEFVQETFNAWRNFPQIKVINFTWLHELPTQEVERFAAFYGANENQPFKEFLGSLGLRTYEGKDKPAFRVLKANVDVKRW